MADIPVGPRTASELPGYRPVLSGPQLEVLHRYGAEQRVAMGDVLVRDGDETYDLIVLLTGQRAYLTVVVSAAGRVLRIPVQQVHTIMDQELELSELILRAFLVRHSR